MTYLYDPEEWLLSTTRGVKSWAVEHLNPALYDVTMEFPGSLLDAQSMPFTKALVHFAVDDIIERPVGFGEGDFALNYDDVAQTVNRQYAMMHQINFDVGIWTSDKSGGTTARAVIRQILTEMFGIKGREQFRAATDDGDGGVQVINFTGGRNVVDDIGDVPIFRTVNSELEVRVFSRTKLKPDEAVPSIEEIGQLPGLTILG